MIAVIWEFAVRDGAIADFERAYGPDGDWAALFRRHRGYEGTALLRDVAAAGRYLTVDRWADRPAFDAMRLAARDEYARLDAALAALTVSEREIGVFDVA